MKTMAWLKRAITVLISAVLIASTGLYAYAENEEKTDQNLEAATLGDQYDATNMWLSDLEGSVQLIEEGVPPMKPEKNMRMKSGQALETEEESLAILDLDRERLAIMDEISLASFEETHHGDRISISLTKGAMYFRVGIPLQDDESFEITMENIVLSVRGTCGMVQITDEEIIIILASGHAIISKLETGQAVVDEGEQISIEAGEKAVFPLQGTDSRNEYTKERLLEKDVPEFLWVGLWNDPDSDNQFDRVYKETTWMDPESAWIYDVLMPRFESEALGMTPEQSKELRNLIFKGEAYDKSGVPAAQYGQYTDYYREILSKANNDPGSLWKEEPLDYVNPEDRCQYALVRTAEDEPVPALLLKSRETGSGRYISVFQYDSKSETVSRANPDYPIIDPETSLRLKPGGPGFLEMKEREGWRYANEIHIVNGSIKWSRFFRSAAEMEICYVNDADWQWVSNEVLEVMTRGGEIAWLEIP